MWSEGELEGAEEEQLGYPQVHGNSAI